MLRQAVHAFSLALIIGILLTAAGVRTIEFSAGPDLTWHPGDTDPIHMAAPAPRLAAIATSGTAPMCMTSIPTSAGSGGMAVLTTCGVGGGGR